MDINKYRNIYFTGIKGVGMTAMALYFQDMGARVSGSDVAEVFVTDEILKKRNIVWKKGFNKDNIENDTELLIATAAHGGSENEEAVYAKQKNITVKTYAESLGDISFGKETICVCGVGGKTTTSSMLAVLFDSADLNPSFIVGVGNIFPLGTSGRYSEKGRYFICEADDYAISPGINNDAKFSLLKPKIIIATNIEYDHPDIYRNFDETKNAFLNFFNKTPKYGRLIVNADNKNTMEVANKSKADWVSYGMDKLSDYRIKNIKYRDQKTLFDIFIKKTKKYVKDLTLNVPGEFNVRNAASVFAAGDILGIEEDKMRFGLERYLGCRRRFEDIMSFKGAKYYDDYAHHPGEIKATLKAAKAWFPDRKVNVIFQPHTYSRTFALLDEFSKCFKDADKVCIMEIYSSAREKVNNNVNSGILVDKTSKFNKNTSYAKDHKSVIKWIDKYVKPGDVVITMGAGDIFHLYDLLRSERSSA